MNTRAARATGAYDVLIVGGGASGLACSITCAENGLRVGVVESDVACGLKLLATGNGRCNYSNARLDPARYRDPAYASAVFASGEQAPEEEVGCFFERLGLFSVCEEGRLYPASRRAESVRDVLLNACARAGVDLVPCHEATSIERDGDRWLVRALAPAAPLDVPAKDAGNERKLRRALAAAEKRERVLRARCLVIATGGSESLLEPLRVPSTPRKPVLCPLSCTAPWLADLDGQRAVCAVSLRRDSKEVYCEEGEVLFRPYGISGIVAFDLSRRAVPGDVIELDLFPGISAKELERRFAERERLLGAPVEPEWLAGALAAPLARAVFSIARSNIADHPSARALAGTAKRLSLAVTGLAETARAQVTRGGVRLDAVDAATMRVRGRDGLYVLGEALDMDADCGGYNLAWAWLTGIRAGHAIASAAAEKGERSVPTSDPRRPRTATR